jgi:hypothetical protein
MLNDDDFHIPDELRCCITTDVMQQPYVAVDGFTYELDAILAWLRRSNVSPRSNDPIPSRLVPNLALKTLIQEWPVICERIVKHHHTKQAAAASSQPASGSDAEKIRLLTAAVSARELDLQDVKAALRSARDEARDLRRANEELQAEVAELKARNRRVSEIAAELTRLSLSGAN